MERILGGTLVGGSVVRSIADADRGGGPPDPTDDARGGPAPVGGVGIALEVLIPGDAVWARGGGGGGTAFTASSTPAFESDRKRFSFIRT